MKYKVGDKVKIKPSKRIERKGCPCFVPSMSKYCSRYATIVKVGHNYYNIDIDDKRWEWADYMFEELNLCEILRGYEGNTFYSLIYGNIIFLSIETIDGNKYQLWLF